ncbi:MAG: DUF3604 domain-containing protein [Parachlamydiaceae bacterium]
MRRSICYCEPSVVSAGEKNTIQFVYTPSIDLPKGSKLKFDMMSRGREIDWETPTANLKKTSNLIYLVIGGKKLVAGKEVLPKDEIVPQYEFVLPEKVSAATPLTIVVGSPKLTGKEAVAKGTDAQKNTQRRRPFHLFIDPTGKGKYSEPEVFTLDIRGSTLQTIRLLTPSFVVKNKRFDIILRFEDEFGNLTNNAPEDTLVELSYENIRDNLNWKLFVPETGFITLPNLYFNEEGIYTICLKNPKTKQMFRSFPIKCFNDNSKHLYWGLLHGESERYDSTENIDSCLRHFRDEKAMNFYSVSPFEDSDELSQDNWKAIHQTLTEFSEDDRFITFSGVQWVGAPHKEGIKQLLFFKEAKQLPRKKENKGATIDKIYKSSSPKEMIAIPSFTMAKKYEYDFKNWDPQFERVVEIYNSWGSSECLKKEGNEVPIKSSSKAGIQESVEGSIQKALLNNCRFGFVGGGLDDRGIYSDFYDGGQEQYPPGLTAIMATEHTRQAIAEALYNRSCYATTGERILLGLELAGNGMGKELSTVEKPGFMINRHLTGFVAGTADLVKVEILRNGKVIHTYEPDEGYSFKFAYDDMESLEKVCIKPKDKKPPFVFYYIRAVQEDGHMAWSSPIWVDYIPVKLQRSVKKTATKAQPKAVVVEEEESFDEDDYDEE